MTDLVFPLLQVAGGFISSFRDEESFRRAMSMTTNKAITEGFIQEARLIDARLIHYRIERLDLVGSIGLFAWMRRGRDIRELRLGVVGKLEMNEVRAMVANAVRDSEFWAENEDVESIVSKVNAAKTFSELSELFG